MRGSPVCHRILAAVLASGTGAAAAGAAGDADAIDYRFRLVTSPELQVRVQAAFTSDAQGETTFEVSRDWGGVQAGGEDISDVRVLDPSGKSLEVEHPEPHRWRVRSAPGARLVVDYAFAPNDHQGNMSPDVHRRPLLGPRLFHAYGYLALLRPSHLEGGDRRRASVEWEGFEPAGWRTVCSFGVGAGPHAFEASLEELGSAVYMAGDLEVVKREVEGRPVWTAFARNEWRFATSEFADLVQRIVGIERGFFSELDQPFYLVTVIPVGEVSPGSRSLGGTGLTNSFSLAMLPDTELGSPLGAQLGIGGLLAHEMFHEWNGDTIVRQEPEELAYWFTEGFTDFYTRRLLLRGGLIGPEEYATSVNAKLAELFASPVRNAPNERIHAEFWRDPGVKRLPYVRGDVVAMLADAAMRRSSNGERGLDDFMRELVRDARKAGSRYAMQELLDRIAAQVDPGTAEHLRDIVVNGATPRVEPALFEPCMEMRLEPLTSFDLGFDIEATRQDKRIRGVRAASAAEAAGLRDDMKIRSWSVAIGDAKRPVEIKVDDSGSERVITYLPAGAPVPTPQFFVRPDSGGCRDL